MIDNISLLKGSKKDKNESSVFRPSTAAVSTVTEQKLRQLEEIMDDSLIENKPLIFLHHGYPKDEYDDDEVYALSQRDFQTRFFMSSLAVNMNSVWLRNHHSDNFHSMSNFTYVRDFFKAAYTTKNHTAAKATLTSEVTKWLNLDHHEYYTYATTLASALSDEGANTSFQIHEAMVKSPDHLQLARQTFVVLMDILFSKVYFKTFLFKEGNSNIYRLVHCSTKHTRNYSSFKYAIFSFLLQVALTTFVVLQLSASVKDGILSEKKEMITLALLGAIYG